MNQDFITKRLEFGVEMSNYKKLLWKKIAFYTRDFSITSTELIDLIQSWGLTAPKNLNIKQLLNVLENASSIELQDLKEIDKFELFTIDKRLLCQSQKGNVGDSDNILRNIIKNNSYKYQSLLINKYNKCLNDIYGELYDEIENNIDIEVINKLSGRLFEFLITHVCQVADYFLHLRQVEDKEMSLNEFLQIKPLRHQFDYRGYSSFINTVLTIKNIVETNIFNNIDVFTIIYPTLIILRGYCAFSVLIALMIDAQASSKFPSGYSKLVSFLLDNFQNSSIFRLERSISPALHSESMSTRGAESYTTQFKIFLFDRHMMPTLLRLDLPHKGQENLHVNVQLFNGKSDLDHHKIEGLFNNVDCFFDSFKEQIDNEANLLFEWKNTNKQDDKLTLQLMNDYLLYNEICLNYIRKIIKNNCLEITDEDQKILDMFSFSIQGCRYLDIIKGIYTNLIG